MMIVSYGFREDKSSDHHMLRHGSSESKFGSKVFIDLVLAADCTFLIEVEIAGQTAGMRGAKRTSPPSHILTEHFITAIEELLITECVVKHSQSELTSLVPLPPFQFCPGLTSYTETRDSN